MPYIAGAARQVYAEGVPIMRAMVVEFPGDPACTHLERQYMLGDDLLVAPVFSPGGDVSYYLPAGTWTHYLTGRTVCGPGWVREKHSVLSVPLLVRPGAVIPEGAVVDRPDYDYADGVTLRAYEIAAGARVTTVVPAPGGDRVSDGAATFVTTRENNVIRVVATGTSPTWRFMLVGIPRVAAVEGGTASRCDHGTVVQAGADTLVITLEEAP
jgi:alpha-D-xyloside xylohydrolase